MIRIVMMCPFLSGTTPPPTLRGGITGDVGAFFNAPVLVLEGSPGVGVGGAVVSSPWGAATSRTVGTVEAVEVFSGDAPVSLRISSMAASRPPSKSLALNAFSSVSTIASTRGLVKTDRAESLGSTRSLCSFLAIRM